MKTLFTGLTTLLLSTSLSQAAPVYLESTGHYYEYVSTAYDFEGALAAASSSTYLGLQGYLATITSQEENDLLSTLRLDHSWIGASDADNEGFWSWVTGSEVGTVFFDNGTCLTYCNFAGGQPDSYYAGENNAIMWPNGSWNDTLSTGVVGGYLAEYGGLEDFGSVPLPAGLPLMLSAPGAGALLRLRRRES